MIGIAEIKSKLKAFKKRFYVRQIFIGSLLFLIISFSIFLLINGLEYQLWMSSTARLIIFFLSTASVLTLLVWLVGIPVSQLLKLRRGLTDEAAALEISHSFPEIKDKLINTLQLSNLSDKDNLLLQAAIDKKANTIKHIPFIKAVDFTAGKRYAIVLFAILASMALVSFINPTLLKDSTKRIVNFNQEFSPEAPFTFLLDNKHLQAFRGEDFELIVTIKGQAVPERLNLLVDGRTLRLGQTGSDTFNYIFNKIQESKEFQLEGAGFFSPVYQIIVNERPNLIAMNIAIQSPAYTGGTRKLINNSGDLTILEGSSVSWEISTLSTDSLQFFFNNEEVPGSRTQENVFEINERIYTSGAYHLDLFNQFGKNAAELSYAVTVIKDKKPTINAEYFPDSTMYKFVTLAGNIIDDHGFSDLRLNYKKEGDKLRSIPLDLAPNVKKQSFYASWNIDSLALETGERLEFFVSVSDNDAVNGSKTSRSRTFLLEIPDEKEIAKIIDEKSEVVENQIDKSQKEAESINERLEEIEERLKGEQKFDWQEKKQLSDIIEDRENLAEQIEELQKQHEDLQRTNDKFNRRSEQLQEQDKELQSLLDELLDEKTRELYEQLKELLREQNPSSDQVRQQLQDIQRNEKNLERELDRALELFKRLKMETALEQSLQQLDSLSQRQNEVADENTESADQNDIEERQEDIQEEFNEFREKMNEVQQMNQELKRPAPMQDFELEERQISKELREIQEELESQNEGSNSEEQNSQENNEGSQQNSEGSEENNEGSQENSQNPQDSDTSEQNSDQQSNPGNQKSGQQSRQQTQQKQKNASQRMKQLSQQMSSMQSGMQMEMMQANLDQLRDILDNLVKLSFNQEELMVEMRKVNQSDPRFLELSQAQLKLKDDAKVIQDSLLSLAERVVQISSFITREVGSINENIDEALDHLKNRNRGRALSSQQFAMTSINNLALLLDDTMQQMQMAMSEAMGNPSQGQQQQKGLPDLGQMQDQLGEKINELKGSGKQGRELSEELARLAAEQELIRRQLEMLKEAEDGRPGGSGGGDELQRAINQMEQNEIDLVNKRLTQQLINRQKSIMTRMLEAEKAQREQEMEEEREAESPSVFSREIPPQFEEYLKLRQKEIELLKTIPVELNPFYKKEVNDYFRRISSDNTND